MMKDFLQQIGRSILIPTWAVGMSLMVASLMASHWVVLPRPSEGTVLSAGSELNLRAINQPWMALHILYGDCPCSRRVLKELLRRTPLPEVTERIVFIGRDDAMKAEAQRKGFQTDQVTPEQLRVRYGIESAPLLVVVDGSGTIHYSGGYTSRKQGYAIQDVLKIDNAISGKDQTSLPVYGCAVSERLDRLMDPLGLKK